MSTDATGTVAALGAWRDRFTARLQTAQHGPGLRVLRIAVTLAIVGVLVWQLSGIGWAAILNALPTRPLFYVMLVMAYAALPVTEVFIYRPLWQFARRDILAACARKRVLNEEVIGYSGEVFLYLWANRRGVESGAAFRTVRDVNIVSSVVSFSVAGLLVAVMVAADELDLGRWSLGIYGVAGLVLAAGLVALGVRFRRYVFALPRREAFRVGALHTARHVFTNAVLIVMWTVAQPDVPLTVWLTFAAVLVVIERLPFLPSKDLVFLGTGVELSRGMQVGTVAIAGMLLVQSAGFKVLNLLVFLTTTLWLRATDPAALTSAPEAKNGDGFSETDPSGERVL